MRDINLLKHSEAVSTFVDFLTGNLNKIIVKGQKGEPIGIETYLGGFILSGFCIDENNNKTIEDNFINNYKQEKRVYQGELKG